MQAKAKDDGGDGEYAEKKSYLRNSKELLRLNQSSPSTTSTEDLDQIDGGGGGRRFGKSEYSLNISLLEKSPFIQIRAALKECFALEESF